MAAPRGPLIDAWVMRPPYDGRRSGTSIVGVALAAALLLGVSPASAADDVILLKNGGRVRGQVIEDDGVRVRVLLADKTVRVMPKAEVLRIEYADAATSSPAVPTSPAPVATPAPPAAAAPAPAQAPAASPAGTIAIPTAVAPAAPAAPAQRPAFPPLTSRRVEGGARHQLEVGEQPQLPLVLAGFGGFVGIYVVTVVVAHLNDNDRKNRITPAHSAIPVVGPFLIAGLSRDADTNADVTLVLFGAVQIAALGVGVAGLIFQREKMSWIPDNAAASIEPVVTIGEHGGVFGLRGAL